MNDDEAAGRFLTTGVTVPHIDPDTAAVWLAVAHQVARKTGGTIRSGMEEPGPGRNYYLLRMAAADGGRLRLMLNAAARLIPAVDDTDPYSLDAAFVPVPRPDLFQMAGLRVADAVDMMQRVPDEAISGLTASEIWDGRYHCPGRVSDVLFNWFD